jgi:N-acetylmuramoyl-L-alanine amidase
MRLCAVTFLLLLALVCSSQTICIDPGHPSENGVGTRGIHISEVKAAWQVALKLRDILKADGFKVVMTKTSEMEVVTNIRRAQIANDAHASLAVRIHCDAGSRSGFATYYPGTQGKSHGVTGPSDEVIQLSHAAAERFHPAVIEALHGAVGDRGLHTDSATMIGGRQGGALTGSVFSKVPVLLVEMAVLQNAHDDAFIASDAGQEQMAKALAAGVRAAVNR